MISELPYRPNVCMVILNKLDQVFLGERNGEAGVWQLPQGGVEPEGSTDESVYRELHEELGAPRELFSIIKRLESTHQYDFTTVPAYAVGRWRGQVQTFWLVRFIGEDHDINLTLYDPEFMAWEWCDLGSVRQRVEPKRLHGYEGPLREVEEYLRSPPPG